MSPRAAPRPCTWPGCGALVRGGARCPQHQGLERREADQRRGTAAERGYGSRWQKARVGYLCSHPLCRACEAEGRVTAAVHVDHIVPHKGDPSLFWDSDNWQPLCARCHNAKTAREDGGFGR